MRVVIQTVFILADGGVSIVTVNEHSGYSLVAYVREMIHQFTNGRL